MATVFEYDAPSGLTVAVTDSGEVLLTAVGLTGAVVMVALPDAQVEELRSALLQALLLRQKQKDEARSAG